MKFSDLNPKGYLLTDVQKSNLQKLCATLIRIEVEFGKPLVIDRAFSTPEEQMAIYDRINSERVKKNLPAVTVPMGSAHLKGCAADVADVDGALTEFLVTNLQLRKELGVALEARSATPTWVHIQTYLPASGHLIFSP